MAVRFIPPPWYPPRSVGPTFTLIGQHSGFRDYSPIRSVRRFHAPVYPVHNRTELYRTPIETDGFQVDMDPQFSFDIALGEAEATKGQPIVATLHQLAGEVDGVVEAFRIAGLIR